MPAFRPLAGLIGVLLLAALALACGNNAESPAGAVAGVSQTPAAPPTSVAFRQGPAASSAHTAAPGAPLEQRPLAELSSSAAAYAQHFPGCCIGIAVAFPSEGVIYTLNGDAPFLMVSVAKVPLMLTLLSQAETKGRELSEDELSLLSAMITLSDNDAADAVYNLVGGATGVSSLLESAGVTGASIDPESWGSSTISPADAALLMSRVIRGEVVGEPYLGLALNLMANIAPYQAWGVTGGTGIDASTGVKNGWYLEETGWRLNSLGYVLPDDGPSYTMAVFTYGALNYWTARNEIELLASRINSDRPLSVAARP